MKLDLPRRPLIILEFAAGGFAVLQGTAVLVWAPSSWPLTILNYVPGFLCIGFGIKVWRSKR